MINQNTVARAQWRSFSSYLLVTIGAVVGLGNIFHFPFLMAKYGGLFFLFFILSEIIISIPLLFADLVIGRRGKQNPVGSISIVAMESEGSRYWRLVGWLCFFIAFFTVSYYTVSVAFPVGYFFNSVSSNQLNLTSDFVALEICFLFFLLVTMVVVARGINKGLEVISAITVPCYFVILLGLAVYSSTHGNFIGALHSLFQINSDQAILPILVAALTYAFFKLNIGMGTMMVYGSYLPYSVPLVRSTLFIVLFDIVISLLSYFIISPLMLLQTDAVVHDKALSFYQNIMIIFNMVPHGEIIAILFFFAAIIAAWTPTIAMAETAVITLIERLQLSRYIATFLVTVCAILVGTVVVGSDTLASHVMLFDRWSIAGFIQNIVSDCATPISAFLLAIFCGWVATRDITAKELGFKQSVYFIWRFLLRYVVPVFILMILVQIAG